MAGELTTTMTFADGEQVTSAKLNQIISGASFTTSAVTGTTLTVTGGKLKVGTITSSELGSACVTAPAIASNAVTTAKIFDGNVTTAKIADNAVTAAKIADGVITASLLSTGIYAQQTQLHSETAGYVISPDKIKHALGHAKAYGEFNITTSSRSIKANSLNVASLTRIDSTHTTVTLTTNMSSDNYTVLVTFVGDSSSSAVAVYDKAAGSFKIRHPAEAASQAVNFVVFGKYV